MKEEITSGIRVFIGFSILFSLNFFVISKIKYKNKLDVNVNKNELEEMMKDNDVEFKVYLNAKYYRDEEDPEGKICPVSWKYVDKPEKSDIIAFSVLGNLKQINKIEKYKYDKERQKLLLMSMETPYYDNGRYKALNTKRKYFDYVMDYHLDSDVPLTYTYPFFNFSTPALPLEEKGKDGRGLVVTFISNCNASNDRIKILKELMKYVKVDSYGKCVHNKDIYEDDKVDFSKEKLSLYRSKNHVEKTYIIRKYKFTLAFENVSERDYVTEKFFQPLEIGSVPIYYGAPNIEDFAPEHSYINIKDFKSVKELADYIKYLDENDEEYKKYFAWKKNGYGENFRRVIEMGKINHMCQLLQRIKNMWINPFLAEWDRHDVPKEERACRLCQKSYKTNQLSFPFFLSFFLFIIFIFIFTSFCI